MSARSTTRGGFPRISRMAMLGLPLLGIGLSSEGVGAAEPPQTFAIETYAGRAYNYLNNMVDKDALPYFDVFWTEPAEAAHDWPDFGDVMSRQLQGAIMARRMTGEECRNEKTWLKKVLSYLDPETGLLVRPKTTFSDPVSYAGDQALTLYALVTAYSDSKDPALRTAICKMVDHIASTTKPETQESGFAVKGLMACARELNYEPALKVAGEKVRAIFADTPGGTFTPDNTFRHGGHMHGNLRTLVGAADYALYVKDAVLYSRVDALYRYVRSTGARFGFIPEVIGRQGDVVSCETCALMDYIGLAVTLANNGHPEYWGDVERIVRNQMVESQLADGSWLKPGDKADSDQFTWREVGKRMVGAYAGWSSPAQFLGARETLPFWGGPELHDKTRAFQNCCGGSGTHALFIAWKNASRFEDGRNGGLSVNLHFDKLLPEAEIRGFQPYKGLVTIQLKKACRVRVRIPEFVDAKDMKVKTNSGAEIEAKVWGNYLELGERPVNDKIEVSYPLSVHDEEETIGNPGFRQYRYRVTWKGDTVVRMTLLGDAPKMVYSDYDKRDVEVFYGAEGPCPIYQREAMLGDAEPKFTTLHMDDGSLDYWSPR
jgi:hypothetical protein